MGTYQRTHIAPDAVFRDPFRDEGRDSAALILGSLHRMYAVGIIHECGDRDSVSRLIVGWDLNLPNVFRQGLINDFLRILQRRPCFGNVDLLYGSKTGIHSCAVHVNDLVALFGICLDDGLFHIIHGVINGQHTGQFEESGLKNGIRTVSESDLRGNLGGINGIETDLSLGKKPLGTVGQMLLQSVHIPVRVEKEGSTLFDLPDNIEALHIALLMTGNEVRHRHIIGGADRFVSEPQMALGHTAGFFGIILKVCLCILVGVVSDDLDGVLVGADGTIGTKTPELAGQYGFSRSYDILTDGKRTHRHIVINPHGEMILLFPGHVVKHCFDMCGNSVFGGQAVPASQDLHCPRALTQSRADIFVQRFAYATRFLGPVQNGNHLNGIRNCIQQMGNRERTVQMNLYHTYLLALCHQIIHNFHRGFTDRSHGNDDTLCLRIPIIVKQLIVSSGEFVDGIHLFLHYFGKLIIRRVAGFSALEKGIRILQCGTDCRMLGVQCMIPEIVDPVPVDEFGKILVIQNIDLLNLMTGAETIKEMHERNGTLNGAQMCYCCKIHALLNTGGRQLCKAGLTAGHSVGLISKNRDGMGSDRACRYVHHSRELRSGDSVHGGDHEHQTLRSGIGGRQGSGLQSTVHGTARSGLTLHLHQLHRLSEQILFPVSCPVIHMVRHGAGRSDGIDGSHFCKCIACVCGGFISVHSLFYCHKGSSSFY